jgi:hypothetical protein
VVTLEPYDSAREPVEVVDESESPNAWRHARQALRSLGIQQEPRYVALSGKVEQDRSVIYVA